MDIILYARQKMYFSLYKPNITIVKIKIYIVDVAELSRALGICKAKQLVLQCLNGVSLNPVEGEQKLCPLKNLILTMLC